MQRHDVTVAPVNDTHQFVLYCSCGVELYESPTADELRDSDGIAFSYLFEIVRKHAEAVFPLMVIQARPEPPMVTISREEILAIMRPGRGAAPQSEDNGAAMPTDK
jgi:hypothetical protein